MADTGRRNFLIGSAVFPATASAALTSNPGGALLQAVDRDLAAYIGFGGKQAGSTGDDACGNWLAGELDRLGFQVERQTFSAPYFTPRRCELATGDVKAVLWPQPIVVPTGPAGIAGRLVRVGPLGQPDGPLRDAIALLDLPFGRLSSALAKPIREPIAATIAAGARAVVGITNGPTGRIIALNADGRKPMFDAPVALLAPADARQFLAAAARGDNATLVVDGAGGRRPAFNFVGRIDRRKPRWLVVSTPRSGWFGCAGERGPGVAVWLWLARWASRAVTEYNLAFVCNSGHEYEYLGAAEALEHIVPKPAETHLWLHLGANLAANDWHEFPPQWRPLPSADPQRYLSVSPALVPLARRVFAGHVGFEAPYSTADLVAGELTEIVAAGYSRAAGVFGVHRFHHVDLDDARCVSADTVASTANAFQMFVEKAI